MAVIRLATATRNAMVSAVVALIDGGPAAGTIEIRSGTMPATPNDAPADGALLGTVTFGDPAFGAPSNGTATANPLTPDPAADATGQATWARIKDSNGNAVFDCDVTATGGGGVIQLNTTSIVAGGPISITSFTLTQPAS